MRKREWKAVVISDTQGRVDERMHAFDGERLACGRAWDTMSARSVWRIVEFGRCPDCEKAVQP